MDLRALILSIAVEVHRNKLIQSDSRIWLSSLLEIMRFPKRRCPNSIRVLVNSIAPPHFANRLPHFLIHNGM